MSAFHHRCIEGSDVCVYCLEDWPCQVGKLRDELAEAIRAERVSAWDRGVQDWDADDAADFISTKGCHR